MQHGRARTAPAAAPRHANVSQRVSFLDATAVQSSHRLKEVSLASRGAETFAGMLLACGCDEEVQVVESSSDAWAEASLSVFLLVVMVIRMEAAMTASSTRFWRHAALGLCALTSTPHAEEDFSLRR